MTTMTKAKFIEMITYASKLIDENHKTLSKLDAITGDGDHGITIKRTMDAILKSANENSDKEFQPLLQALAMSAMSCDGGSTSPLIGSWFMGMSQGASSDELTASETANFFQVALKSMLAISKAQLGDKTMMDALIPATNALSDELNASGNLSIAMQKASKSASEGAKKTKNQIAKFGRARTMGERAIGHIDPGAVSFSHIFNGFAQACNK